VLKVLYHRAKFGGAQISPAAGTAKNVEYFCLLQAALRAAQTCRYLVYSEADFEFFSPRRGDTLHRWGEIWHRAKFQPHRCNDKGVGAQN